MSRVAECTGNRVRWNDALAVISSGRHGIRRVKPTDLLVLSIDEHKAYVLCGVPVRAQV